MEDAHRTGSVNPADVPVVTLDTNALIAVREQEPAAMAVNDLLDMNRLRRITINVTLSTALEAGRNGKWHEWAEQIAWLEGLGIARSTIFTGPRTIGFRTLDAPDALTFGPEYERALNQRIHSILRPIIPFDWYTYRNREGARAGISLDALAEYDFASMHNFIPQPPQHPAMARPSVFDQLSPDQQGRVQDVHWKLQRNWHNAKNDSLGLYNHLTVAAHTHHSEWSVFVTSDHHFLAPTKLAALRALGFRGEILPPADAVTFLRAITRGQVDKQAEIVP